MVTFEVQASSDDGYEFGDESSLITIVKNYHRRYTDLEGRRDTAFRFVNVTIPKGAVITSAYVRQYLDADNYDDIDCDIYAQDVDNAVTISETACQRIVCRTPLTTATVAWAELDQGIGWKNGPDIKNIIQEIVNRDGWVSGNALIIIYKSKHGGGLNWRCLSYDNATPPQLIVEWEEAGEAGSMSSAISALESVGLI